MTSPKSLARVTIGPVSLHGNAIVLRPPRIADYPHWRRIRLRDRHFIEPFWYSSTLDWAARHCGAQWVRECLTSRDEARAGLRLSTVIEVDGRFAGQVELGSIDTATASAELGIWVDAEVARHGIGGMAAALLMDYCLEQLGLERITAPISPENVAAAHGAAELGFRREAMMSRYFDVGGARRDHELWAVTRADVPANGFAGHWLDRHDTHARRPPPAGEDATDASFPKCAVFGAAARYYAGRILHLLDPLRAARPVRLADPERRDLVVRSRRLSDWGRWRAARLRGRAELDPDPAGTEQDWARRHSRLRWFSEYLCARPGLRSACGLVLAIEVDGRYAGEARLFDLDMFDRNARMFVWTEPGHGDDVRAAATRLLLEHAFGSLGLCRISTAVEPEDGRSAEVAAAVGMIREGRMRGYVGATGHRADHDLWAVTRCASDTESSAPSARRSSGPTEHP
ncbi:ribosomal-protein-alanine N-acetyltransferase [Nocardia tenerifensis]|uniref:Ribosomal-protein-alanine N-acetyltransferase n=1 Tax=Nocardia tenerifensis TaxID=228006 RepID=A0A318JRE1_9NOCA|nr:GNAT family protein [Nocardia tenerifensis]PXX58359.1 ribosomal-protein-alanine N-acetyltransferase [Nocardia tenerifensis]